MARNRNRSIALSALETTRAASLSDIAKMGWAQMPTYLSARACKSLPLTTAEFDGLFSGDIQLFSNQPTDSDKTFSPNVATGQTVNSFFFAVGLGVIAVSDSLGFAVQGASVPLDALNTEGKAVCFEGCVEGNEAGISNAVLDWGHPAWDAIAHFFQGYTLQMTLGGRMIIADEPISEIGMISEAAEFQGLGTANISAMPYINAVNKVLKDKGYGVAFIPQNAAGSACAQPPTPSVQWSHPKVKGVSNRLFCLPKGTVIAPGQSINIDLYQVDGQCAVSEKLRRVLELQAFQKPTADMANTTTCDTLTGVTTIPGGDLTIGILLKGVEVAPSAVVEWFEGYASSEIVAQYVGNPHVVALASRYLQGLSSSDPRRGGLLAGLSDPTGQSLRDLVGGR